MKGQCFQTRQDSPSCSVAPFGQPGDSVAFDGDQSELTGNEEGIDGDEKRDNCEPGDRVNGERPSGSRFELRLVARSRRSSRFALLLPPGRFELTRARYVAS